VNAQTLVPVLLVLLLLLPMPVAAARTPTRPAGTPAEPIAWAYAGTLEQAGSTVVGQVALGYSDGSNYAVVLNQSGANGSAIELSISRLITTRSYFIACYPNCTDPKDSMTANGVGLEFDTAQLTLTRNASVEVNGTRVSALGLSGENLTLAGNLSVRFSWENYTGRSGYREEWFNATTLANTTGEFNATTPLGLVPSVLSPGERWTGDGAFDAAASTTFSGRSSYQGSLIPANGSEFHGTSVPITPMTVEVNGSDAGTPTDAQLAGDAAVAFAPAPDGTSLLEGAILVPTSAYIAAAFSSDCDEAQRACVGLGATPQLEYNASESAHLGWDAAVSSVSAFSLFLEPAAVLDTPDGLPFWPAAAEAAPTPATVASVPATVTGLPVAVPLAISIQRAFYPTPNPNASSGNPLPSDGASPRPPTTSGGRLAGGLPGPAARLPVALVGAPGLSSFAILAGVAVLAAVGLGASALAVRRRRAPRRKGSDRLDPPPTDEPPTEGGEPPEDPMGYVW
jgi:hypothetical protein